MERVRLRVKFEDRHMLTRLQKSEGLNRCWILLAPQHQTISDISSYLIDAFQLGHTCSNGVILSMNGFVLPPFESVDILNDNDEISVKKKRFKLSNVLKESEDEGQLMTVDKQPGHSAIPLLDNKEFEKEAGGYESDIEENDNEAVDVLPVAYPVKDEILKKNKAGKSVQSTSKKRNCNMITEQSEINVSKEDKKDYENIPTTENELNCAQSPKDKSSKKTKSVNHPEGNGAVTKNSDDIPASAQKVPSRSARRKKAQRFWKWEAKKKEMERLKLAENEEKSQNDNQKNPIECQSVETDEQMNPTMYQSPQKDNHKNPIECQSVETDEQMNPTKCQSPRKDNHKNPIECQSLENDEQISPRKCQSPQMNYHNNPLECQSIETDEQMNPTECPSPQKDNQSANPLELMNK